MSVVSNVSSNVNRGMENQKPSIQSLSIICQEEEQEEQTALKRDVSSKLKSCKSLIESKPHSGKVIRGRESESLQTNSANSRNQLSVPDFNKFPLTSTPNNEMEGWQSWTSGRCYDIALWQHITCCLFVFALCWVPTTCFLNGGKGKLLVDVVGDIIDSFWCHTGMGSSLNCSYLPTVTILLSVSYVGLILSSIEVLKTAQSAVTVVSVIMSALPVASLFWSLFRINSGSTDILEFSPQITGEAVCAVLGLPIIGIGIVLLMKSHIREFKLIV